MDAVTITILQTAVMGPVFTEWMSKIRAEEITYDLITAMADDFFFAYDVIDFIALPTKEAKIYNSGWCYVSFTFALISMLKYLPYQPVSLTGKKAPRDMATGIVVSLVCCDIPFVIIRLCTLFMYGFKVSDLIHPAKNIALIVFGLAQLFMLWKTVEERKEEQIDSKVRPKPKFPQRRLSRHPECWTDKDGTVWCERSNQQGTPEVTSHPEAFTDEQGNVFFECSETESTPNTEDHDNKERHERYYKKHKLSQGSDPGEDIPPGLTNATYDHTGAE